MKGRKPDKDKIKLKEQRSRIASQDGLEAELNSVRKVSSFTRDKSRRSKPLPEADNANIIPNLEEYSDLMEDEDEVSTEQATNLGYPRRSKSVSLGHSKSSKSLATAASLQSKLLAVSLAETAGSERLQTLSRISNTDTNLPIGSGQSFEGPGKPLPRLLAPRTTIAEAVAANRSAVSVQQIEGSEATREDKDMEGDETGSPPGETHPLTVTTNSGTDKKKKKKHSAAGHLWKTIKQDFLNPRAAAADLQAISVSAAKQATAVVTTVAGRVESDITNFHDQILGGKRNLPDHPSKPKPNSESRTSTNSTFPPEPKEASPVIAVRADTSMSQSLASGSSPGSSKMGAHIPETTVEAAQTAEASTRAGNANIKPVSQKSLKSWLRPATEPGTASLSKTAKPETTEEMVERSRGSAYMLSKYEDESESPSKLAEALNKTADLLSHSTEAILSGTSSSAIYLRKLLMCGRAGRIK